MNRNLLKSYLKQELSGRLITIVLFVVFYFILKDKFILLFLVGLALFNFIKGFFDYKKRQEYLASLAAQGLTETEADDNLFTIKWEKTRKGGIIKYCLIYGGLLIGFWLTLLVGYIAFIIKLSLFGTQINVVNILEFTLPIGVLIGISLSFFAWLGNEKKFARLSH